MVTKGYLKSGAHVTIMRYDIVGPPAETGAYR
jgi:hypothetical protein